LTGDFLLVKITADVAQSRVEGGKAMIIEEGRIFGDWVIRKWWRLSFCNNAEVVMLGRKFTGTIYFRDRELADTIANEAKRNSPTVMIQSKEVFVIAPDPDSPTIPSPSGFVVLPEEVTVLERDTIKAELIETVKRKLTPCEIAILRI
jgi:hypothetical protein